MSNWIFVMTGEQKEFLRRINEKIWPIFNFTNNRAKLQVKDRIIFYGGRVHGHKLLGSAKLATGLKVKGDDFLVTLDEVKIWKKPILIKGILEDLKFVKNKKKWGCHFQGGIITLPNDDYLNILQKINY